MSQIGQQLFRLEESQLAAIVEACRPLRPAERRIFVEELAGKLAGQGVIGDGSLHLAIRDIQRRHFDPPMDAA
jgi:hypothetical protein